MCLNKLVIFSMCGEEKVMVAHFVLFSVFLVGGGVILCCICCFSFCSKVVGKLLDVAFGLPFPELAGAVERES